MVPPRRHHQTARTFIVFALVVHLVVIAAATASPAFHEWMHGDADDDDHDCAVTLFAAGACHDAPVPMIVAAPEWIVFPDEVAIARAGWVSSFRFNGILEHAPPRRA